jgi:RimJ/RimL family protein N-acetyltransferase
MVTLRPIVATDAPAIAAAVDQSLQELRRWMPWAQDSYDIESAKAWIDASLASAAAGAGFQFVMLDESEAIVGVVGLEDMSEHSERAMIGYWVATPATGRGIGRHAIEQAIRLARTQPRLRVIWAVVADANAASRRVLAVNQFRLVATRGIDERGDTALLYELDLHHL